MTANKDSKPSESRYDSIGINYDSTRKADPYLAQRMFHLIQKEDRKSVYLDVGCGTGNYTSALNQMGLSFIGMDPSEEMLRKARNKNPSTNWIKGSAENIPLDSDSIDGVLVSLSIHHWKDLEQGFKEISRVLKQDGKIVLFTTLPVQTRAYWLNNYFPKMMEDSIDILPEYAEIEKAFQNANLKIVQKEKYFVQPDLQDQFLFAGKHNPELYFDPQFRNGVSSFSLLALKPEIESGLAKLRTDINSGKIQSIIQEHENDLGDYLFIVGEKK